MPSIDRLVPRTHIAHLSMEMTIRPEIHSYAGGRGILAGDTAISCADLELPVVFVTLISRAGYFRQRIDDRSRQVEEEDRWRPQDWCVPLDAMIAVPIEGRPVWIRPCLYGGDPDYRLRQEIVLGIGGLRILHALGFELHTYHLNEGHAALLTLGLLNWWRIPPDERIACEPPYDIAAMRERCVFTTHTPVEAGQDRFDYTAFQRILPDFVVRALQLSDDEIWQRHLEAKADLIAEVARRTGAALDPALPTIAYAGRMTAYKRPTLIFSDLDRLTAIAARHPFQLVIAGKAYPRDQDGKAAIQQIHEITRRLEGRIRCVFLPNYDMELARVLVAGADVWLNTPRCLRWRHPAPAARRRRPTSAERGLDSSQGTTSNAGSRPQPAPRSIRSPAVAEAAPATCFERPLQSCSTSSSQSS